MICFVIAMDKEAQPVIAAMKDVKEQKICGKRVICGALYGKEAAIVVCGVGKVNAACGAQLAIDKLNATEIINLGVAGGLDSGLSVGEIYEISAAVQYDFDLTQLNGTQIGTLDECKENYLPLDICGVYPAKRLATGDRFNDSKADFKLLTEVLKADIRDMECGAVAQVCMHAKIPCRSFKIISDLAGSGSTTEQYLNNLSLCFKTLERELEKIAEAMHG
ncbi:MAG: 5'-methylthioadenosine/S-adenosylhomocysteine nucleosidase [Clostridia bacterium]|nr:5'-methylthioadenosine/S-adenosylhomocysteine nucleosidase [Clostridia bacterium]